MARLDLSFTPEELDRYLGSGRTARVATVGRDGVPHVVPLWFVWLDGAMFLNSTLGNVTVENAGANATVAAVVDDGDVYDEFRGVVLHGPLLRADDDPRVVEAGRRWSEKYLAGNPVPYDRWRNRVWLRLDPERVASWDFAKIPEAKAKARTRRERGGPDT